MIKIETTVVKLILCTCIGAMVLAAEAKTKKSEEDDDGSAKVKAEAFKKWDKECQGTVSADKAERCRILKQTFTSGSMAKESCDEAQEKYSKSKSEMISACEEANISSGVADGDIGCGFSIKLCGCRQKGVSSVGELSCNKDSDSEEESTSRTKPGEKNVSELSRLYKYCSGTSARDLEKLQKDYDKSKERLKELEEKVPTSLDEANKAKTSAQEKIDGFDKEIQDAQTKFESESAKAQKGKSEQQKQLMNQIAQLQQQVGQKDKDIAQTRLAQADAAMKRDETKKQIELNCHASASAQVSKMQAESVELMRLGKLNLGTQKDLLKRQGLSDRDAWMRVANKYYQWCLQSKPTIDSKDSADRMFSSVVAQTKQAEAGILKDKAALLEQMKQIKDPSGQCGQVMQQADGSSNETEMCRAAREAAEEQQRLFTSTQREIAGLQKRQQTAQATAAQEYMSKMQIFQKNQSNLADEQSRKRNLEEALSAANADSPVETDSKAHGKARGKVGEFIGNAQTLLTCQNVCPNGAESPGDCQTAAKFLKKIGEYSAAPNLDPVQGASTREALTKLESSSSTNRRRENGPSPRGGSSPDPSTGPGAAAPREP